MNRITGARIALAIAATFATQQGAFAQINTSIETAETQARQTGRPILAIAGSKT